MIFGTLPIEIQMMVFDHLVINKILLGIICMVSHDWKTMTQASYAWKLWILSMLGKEKAIKELTILNVDNHLTIAKDNPLFHAQFAPNGLAFGETVRGWDLRSPTPIDQVSNRVKNILFKKFVYVLELNSDPLQWLDVNNNHINWFQIMCGTGNMDSLKLLHKTFNITKENVQTFAMQTQGFATMLQNQANHNRAFIWSCGWQPIGLPTLV